MPHKDIQEKLLHWFSIHHRDLPWRKTYEPYHIWISEIMLQQTQMDRGVQYFNRWVERFPTIASIAAAHENEILKLWEGLGYYSRARNIKKTANILMDQYCGRLPDDHSALMKLPGIGPYTAGAIMSLAFNQDYPLVDANVERLFSRLFDIAQPIKQHETQKYIWLLASKHVPAGKARFFNQAIMELGALICLSQNPMCDLCPLPDNCMSLQNDTVSQRPVMKRAQKIIPIYMATGILIHDNKCFIQKRPADGVWANLWEFPGGRIEPGETPEQALVREYMEETEFSIVSTKKITTIKHSYMQYRVTLHCFSCKLVNCRTTPTLHAAQEYRWITLGELKEFAFPAGHRKFIEKLRNSHNTLHYID